MEINLFSFAPLLSFQIADDKPSKDVIVNIPYYFLLNSGEFFQNEDPDHPGIFVWVRCDKPFTLKSDKKVSTRQEVSALLLKYNEFIVAHFGSVVKVQVAEAMVSNAEKGK